MTLDIFSEGLQMPIVKIYRRGARNADVFDIIEMNVRIPERAMGDLRAQIAAGVSAIQLFDSWAGALDADDYNTHVAPSVATIFEGLADEGVPRILFGVTTGEILSDMAATGPDVMGVDWRVPLDAARARMPLNISALQGNLDPALALAPWDVLEAKTRDILDRGGGRGHVFNLGHGVLPSTDPAVLARLVDYVHAWRR